jgi:tetratricopeptide (TPR) repeat protein
MTSAYRPENAIDPGSAPLNVAYCCNACGHKGSITVEWAAVNPIPRSEPGWDGICLSRILRCAGCGAEDDYTLAPKSRLELLGRATGAPGFRRSDGRTQLSQNRLPDGTVGRRPSQLLAYLKGIVAQHPSDIKALHNLANALYRFGEVTAAIEAWEQALALNPDDVQSAYGLADAHWVDKDKHPRVLHFLDIALKALPRAMRSDPTVEEFVVPLVGLFAEVVRSVDEPFALVAAWQAGEVKGQPCVDVSSVDVHKIESYHKLAAFLRDADILSAGLVLDMPTEEPTNLQMLLSNNPERLMAGRVAPVDQTQAPLLRGPRVGRNDPCPCGSGKKFKRCCG